MDYWSMRQPEYYPRKKTILDDMETKIKVFAYCRVSTDDEEQLNSLESQKVFFDSLKAEHDNWISYELFYDKGISGTSLEHRDDFKRMIRRAKAGEANLIITKEVSRLSRNIKEALNIIDELLKANVAVYFINNQLCTMDHNEYQLLCNLINAAQQESFQTSERVKFGQRLQMERGVTFGRKEMFGYRIHRDPYTKVQTYEIIEEEAEVIRQIFDWFAAGDGTHRIARRLEENGVSTFRYSNGWSNTVILRILRNEKYVGDLVQGKTYTPKMLTHKKKYQKDKKQWTEVSNHHEPIVDREIWDKVQAILEEKAPSEEQKLKHSNRYWLSGKVFCGVCGGRYVSNIKKKKTCTHKSWVCFEAHTRGVYKEDTIDGIPRGCNGGGMINDKVFKEIVKDFLTVYLKDIKDYLIADAYEKQKQSLTPKKKNTSKIKRLQKEIEKIEERSDKLFLAKLDGECSQEQYERFKNRFKKELEEIKKQLKEEQQSEIDEQRIKQETEDIVKRIEYLVSLKDEEFNDDLFARVTKKIVVYPEHIIEVYIEGFPESFFFHFSAKGKLDNYVVETTFYPKEEAMTIVGDKIVNRVGVKKSMKEIMKL